MKNEQKQQAQNLYLHTGCTQQQIADILNINRRTVYLWIKNGRWDDMKAAARQAPGIILQDIYNHITAVNDKIRSRDEDDRCPTMEEVEKLRKLINMTNTIQKRNVGSYIEAFQELLSYISRTDRSLVEKIIPHASSYITGNFGDKVFHASKERDRNVDEVIVNLAKIASETDPIAADCPVQPSSSEKVDESFCDKNAIFSVTTAPVDNLPEMQSGIDIQPLQPAPAHTKTPIPDISENEIFSSAGVTTKESVPAETSFEEPPKTEFEKMMALPPQQRRSPWRDGDIIWVLDFDHLEYRTDNFGDYWGEEKMGESIRHYPDMYHDARNKRRLIQESQSNNTGKAKDGTEV